MSATTMSQSPSYRGTPSTLRGRRSRTGHPRSQSPSYRGTPSTRLNKTATVLWGRVVSQSPSYRGTPSTRLGTRGGGRGHVRVSIPFLSGNPQHPAGTRRHGVIYDLSLNPLPIGEPPAPDQRTATVNLGPSVSIPFLSGNPQHHTYGSAKTTAKEQSQSPSYRGTPNTASRATSRPASSSLNPLPIGEPPTRAIAENAPQNAVLSQSPSYRGTPNTPTHPPPRNL